jgi:hypothetical protein
MMRENLVPSGNSQATTALLAAACCVFGPSWPCVFPALAALGLWTACSTPVPTIPFSQATGQDIILAGRGKPLRCRYLSAKLRVTDGIQETYAWDAVVGFVAIPLKCPLLGQAGFLHFDVTFQGADHTAILTANWSFSGQRT